MWKPLAAGLALLVPSVLCNAADLSIPAHQVYTVTPAQSDLRLDRLSIGDGAQIHFAPGVSRWRVAAAHVSIGDRVLIDGRGSAGAAGANGGSASGPAKDCNNGSPGVAGGDGAPGSNGVGLVFWWGVDALGDLKILTDGGAGGSGGNGGRGQDAGGANLCAGPDGGRGGRGGNGGAGGRGGDVALGYFNAGAKGAPSLRDRLAISAAAGRPGAAGSGGAGGAGSDGRFQRTPAGDRYFKGGQPGALGAAGSAGTTGSAGAVDIQLVTAGSRPDWAADAGSAAPADRGTVVSLQRQVEALQARTAPAGGSVEQELHALQERIKNLEERVKALEAH